MSEFQMNFSLSIAKYTFNSGLPEYYADMASLLESSKSIRQVDIFLADADRYKGSGRGMLSRVWADRYLENGADLASTWEGFMPEDDVAVLRVQQNLGSDAICQALRDLAKTAKIKKELRSAAQASLGVGALSLLIAAAAVTLMPVWGVGVLQGAFDVPTSDWGPMGRRLAGWAEVAAAYGMYIFLVLFFSIWLCAWSLGAWVGPSRDWADQNILLYRMHHEMFGIQTAMTLGTLTRKNGSSTLTLRSAMEILASSMKSPWKAWQFQRVIEAIDATGGTTASVFGVGIFTKPMFWRLLDVSRAKTLSESFAALAKSIEELWVPKLVFSMGVWRWVMLVSALAVVIVLVAVFQGTVSEMKTVLMNSMS